MLSLAAAAQPKLKIRTMSVGTATTPRGRTESTIAVIEAEPNGLWDILKRAAGYGRTVTLSLTSQRILRVTRGRNDVRSSSIPLTQLASIDYDYDRPIAKLVFGIFASIGGLAGVFAGKPASVLALVVGGLVIAWHFLSGPQFSMQFSSNNGSTIHLKVGAGTRTDELVELVEASCEQLRVLGQAQVAAPQPSAPQASAPPPVPGARTAARS